VLFPVLFPFDWQMHNSNLALCQAHSLTIFIAIHFLGLNASALVGWWSAARPRSDDFFISVHLLG
jgi:hypothetical protein